MNEILDKIKVLRNSDQFDEKAVETFDKWEQEIQEAWAVENLSQHFVVERLVAVANGKIEIINKRLTTQKSNDLPDKGRDLLIAERDLWQIVVSWFSATVAKDKIRSITRSVEDEIKDLKK